MQNRSAWLLLMALAAPGWMFGQNTPDNPSPSPADETGLGRPASFKKLLPNLGTDQKKMWTFPRELRKKRVWIPTAAVLAVTAGLIAADPHEAGYFRNTTSLNSFNRAFSSSNTTYGILAAPAVLFAAGLVRKDSKAKTTAILAAEAVGDSEILTTIFKDLDRRVRPAAVPTGGNFADTWFESPGPFWRGRGSMPSGHTIAAFSVATVFARRYGKQHKWVPFLAYGLAGAVGFSRLSLSAHFLSDVFVGGALGYGISRFVVLRE